MQTCNNSQNTNQYSSHNPVEMTYTKVVQGVDTRIPDNQIKSLNANKLFNTGGILRQYTLPIDNILHSTNPIFESLTDIVGNKTRNQVAYYIQALPTFLTGATDTCGDSTLYTLYDTRLSKQAVIPQLKTVKGNLWKYELLGDTSITKPIPFDANKLISDDFKNLITVGSDGLLMVKIDPSGGLELGANGLKLKTN